MWSSSPTCGWRGRILHVNLSTLKATTETPKTEVYGRYVGGKGLAGAYLKPRITEAWDACAMPLLFFTGPLVGTSAPTSGRMCIMSRSPLTGTIGDTSVGGRLAVQIKRSGWDGIVMTGRSATLRGMEIRDDQVEFVDASRMRGMHVERVTAALKGKGGFAAIGPAAHNGVRFSTIVVDGRHFAGRNGLGLVMAAKNLKYVRVLGTGRIQVADPPTLAKAREEILRLAAASPILGGELGISVYGTGALFDLIHARRMMPTANFRKTYFAPAAHMNAWAYKQAYGMRRGGCTGCTILCKRSSTQNRELPEFETMSHFSALLENTDLDSVVRANQICGSCGMDTISAAATLACHAEIEGRRLEPVEITQLLSAIGNAEGIGGELKQGSLRYARHRGRPECALTVKGQELPAYDPRGSYGMALAYATSTRGACHLRAYPVAYEILRKPVVADRFSFSGKARIIKISEDLNAVVDSLTACKFMFFAAGLEEYALALSGATGVTFSAQDLALAGERIYYNDRTMNSMNGFGRNDDALPARFFEQPGSSGDGITIPALDHAQFESTLDNYYRVRGLASDGSPTEDKLRELGLDDVR